MTEIRETYRAAVTQATCDTCPLRGIDETAWEEVTRTTKDTPYEVAASISNALGRAQVVMNEGPGSAVGDNPDSFYGDLKGSFLQTKAELNGTALEAVQDISGQNGELDTRAAIVCTALAACFEEDCAPIAQADVDPTSDIANLLTAGFGADVLETQARHGSDVEVVRTAQIVIGALEEFDLSEFDFTKPAHCRELLFNMAGLLQNGQL